MYTIIISDAARKQLHKLEKHTAQRIIAALERCRVRPHRHVQRLVDSPHYRLRIGDYRAILRLEDDTLVILVITITHRKRAYQ